MQTKKVFVLIFIVYCLGFFAHAAVLGKTVYGDGVFYYSWVRSVVVDQDLHFSDEYTHFHTGQPKTARALPGNKYTVGPAILWLPWFIWVHALVKGAGYELPYQLITGLSSTLYAMAGLVLLFTLLKKYFSQMASLTAIIVIAGATNLLFYGSLDTVNSHAVSFFAVTLFLTFVFRQSKNWLLIGGTLGLVGLMRTQDMIVGLLILPYIRKKNIVPFVSGLCVAFLPQLAAWQLLYGKFWVSPYISNIEGFNFLQPHLLGVLFSPSNGLLLWTPAVALGFSGLVKQNNRLPTTLMTIIVLLQLYLVASWSIWWQGASYSGRMFVSMLPLLGLGIANLFTIFDLPKLRYPIIMYTITLPLVILNVLMIVYFLAIH